MIHRKINMFEKLLLLTGLAIGVVGFMFINFLFQADGNLMSWNMLITIFIWLTLIFIVILCAIQENQREEIGMITHKQSEETRLLRQITAEMHEETKLMRIDLSYTHNQIVELHKQMARPTQQITAKKSKPKKQTVAKKVVRKKRK